MHYRIADTIVKMESLSGSTLQQAQKYKVDAGSNYDITIGVEPRTLRAAQQKNPQLSLNDCECILTGLLFSRGLLDFDGFCLHSSAVAWRGSAVLFSAPCGTGKSTHARLWQEHFGEENAVVVNDDKPALRLMDDTFYVYGTPWSGKDRINTNMKVPLKAVVFLQQASANHMRRLDTREALPLLLEQSMRPSHDTDKMDKLLSLLDALLVSTPVYRLGCTISSAAVELVRDTVWGVD